MKDWQRVAIRQCLALYRNKKRPNPEHQWMRFEIEAQVTPVMLENPEAILLEFQRELTSRLATKRMEIAMIFASANKAEWVEARKNLTAEENGQCTQTTLT